MPGPVGPNPSLTIAALALASWRGRRAEAPAALGLNVEPSE